MSGIIIWIIIIFVILSINKSKKKGGTAGSKVPGKPQQNPATRQDSRLGQQRQPDQSSAEKQRELKERLNKKYNQQQGSDILSRAKASVEEDFGTTGKAREAEKAAEEAAKIEAEKRARKAQSELERQRELTRRTEEKMKAAPGEAETERSQVLAEVQNLIVMGPNTELTFTRDFVAEGMELLNRIQISDAG